MSKFNLTNFVLQSHYGNNNIIVDDKGLPSVMVYIPKFKMSDVIAGGSDRVHPAFIINGEEKDGIYISKYENVVYNNRAYSLPGEDPSTSVRFEDAINYCTAKGEGWHLMTAMEWGAIALWCKKNAWLPYGNNNSGMDYRESSQKAIPTAQHSYDSSKIHRVATGTGPIEWSHNKQLDGIYDLNGNLCEWCGGLRFVNGELQILSNNDAADRENSQGLTSAQWYAVDGTIGDLITPDGNGTSFQSLKLDYISRTWTWITGSISYPQSSPVQSKYENIIADNSVCTKAKELLYALALMPDDHGLGFENDMLDLIHSSEAVFPTRSGTSVGASSSGIFSTSFESITTLSEDIGFRAAYYK